MIINNRYIVTCDNCGKHSYFDLTNEFKWKHRQDYEAVDCDCGYRTIHHIPVKEYNENNQKNCS